MYTMKNIGIICGGFSSEFEISMKSARNIYENFPKNYQPYLIVLSSEGWHVEFNGQKVGFDSSNFSFKINEETVKIDCAMIYIHGSPGEDGKVQAMLGISGIPYLGSDVLASSLSFDKYFCNQFLKGFGFQVAPSVYLNDVNKIPSDIIQKLGLPVFVKPCDSGSSYGIAKVKCEEELMPAIQQAFDEGDSVVVEGFLDGTEVTCGVYQGTKGTVALPVTEIVTENDFFDYEAKYLGLSDEITPARISPELTKEIQRQSREVFNVLNLKALARVDFMIVNGVPHIIEVNTIPGFTEESLVPKMIEVAGISTAELWGEIIDEYFDRKG